MAKQGLVQRLASGVAGMLSPRAEAAPGTPRGARHGRRSSLFEQERRHINSAIASGGATLRGRCRFLCRENPQARHAKEIWVDYAVGDGWIPSWVHDNAAIKAGLHSGFKRWTDVADYDGLTDYYGLEAMVAAEVFEVGEVFAHLLPDPVLGLRVRLMESEQLPYSTLAAEGYVLPAGHQIRLGVEFDAAGQRVAYHFYREHPGDSTKVPTDAKMLVRIPAEDIRHVFEAQRPGQIRGYPMLATAIVPLFKSDEYEDSLLERAAQGAKFVGFIKRATSQSEDPKAADDEAREGYRSFEAEPGMFYELDADEDMAFTTPPTPGAGYEEFVRRNTMRALIGMGIPYAEGSGDVAAANFTSTRVGQQPFKRRCRRFGNHTLVFQFCAPVVQQWLRWALLTGTVALPRGASRSSDAYGDVNHIPPAWEYVNPVEDAKADKIMVDEGFKPRSRVVEERGYNAEETDDTIESDMKRKVDKKLDIGALASPQVVQAQIAAKARPGVAPASPAAKPANPKEPG